MCECWGTPPGSWGEWPGLGRGGTEGASDPALGIREGFLKEGASALGLGAVCCGKRGWNVPEVLRFRH